MRVLYTGAVAAGEGSSQLRNRGLTEALRLAGIDLLDPPSPSSAVRQVGRLVSRAQKKYMYDVQLAREIERQQPEAVVLYPGLGPLNAARKVLAHQRTPIVADIADWYDWHHVPFSSTPQWVMNEVAVRRSLGRVQGCIATSAHLAAYFGDRGAATEVVTAIFPEVPKSLAQRPDDGICHVAFVGSVTAKDSLAVRHLVEALGILDPTGRRFRAHIVGASAEVVSSLVRSLPRLPESVVVHGRVARQEALDVLAGATFSIVQRDPSRRYAQCGFPSKVAESLLVGTPVMSNLSSDLGEYLVDGGNAILLDGADLDSVVRGLERARESVIQWSAQSISERAQGQFLPAAFANSLRSFFQELVKC